MLTCFSPSSPKLTLKNPRVGTISYIYLYFQDPEYSTWCCYQAVMCFLVLSDWFHFPRSRPGDMNFRANNLFVRSLRKFRQIGGEVCQGRERRNKTYTTKHTGKSGTQCKTHGSEWSYWRGTGAGVFTHQFRLLGELGGINFLACLVLSERASVARDNSQGKRWDFVS